MLLYKSLSHSVVVEVAGSLIFSKWHSIYTPVIQLCHK